MGSHHSKTHTEGQGSSLQGRRRTAVQTGRECEDMGAAEVTAWISLAIFHEVTTHPPFFLDLMILLLQTYREKRKRASRKRCGQMLRIALCIKTSELEIRNWTNKQVVSSHDGLLCNPEKEYAAPWETPKAWGQVTEARRKQLCPESRF